MQKNESLPIGIITSSFPVISFFLYFILEKKLITPSYFNMSILTWLIVLAGLLNITVLIIILARCFQNYLIPYGIYFCLWIACFVCGLLSNQTSLFSFPCDYCQHVLMGMLIIISFVSIISWTGLLRFISLSRSHLHVLLPGRYLALFFIPSSLYLISHMYLKGILVEWFFSRPPSMRLFQIDRLPEINYTHFSVWLILMGLLFHFYYVKKVMSLSSSELYPHSRNTKHALCFIVLLCGIGSMAHYWLFPGIASYNYNIIGYMLTQQGQITRSILAFEKSLCYQPNNNKARLNLGLTYFLNGNHNRAKDCFNAVIHAEPDNATAHLNLGIVYFTQEHYKFAQDHFLASLQYNPNSSKTYAYLGKVCVYLGELDHAIEHLSKALSMQPDDAQTHFYIAVVLSFQGKHQQAIQHLKDAILINPEYVEAHDNLGVALVNIGQVDEAIIYFQKALQIQPNYQPAKDHFESVTQTIFEYAMNHVTHGNMNKGIDLLTKLIEFRPDWKGKLYHAMSKIYTLQGDHNISDIWLKKAIANGYIHEESHNSP